MEFAASAASAPTGGHFDIRKTAREATGSTEAANAIALAYHSIAEHPHCCTEWAGMVYSAPSGVKMSDSVAPTGIVMISIVILTFNEELNISDCLASCAWSDDVHILDSGSTDRTCELAAAAGAQVHHHPFASFGVQRNWAIDNIPQKYDWVFHLDADERFTPEIFDEMREIIRSNPIEAGYYVPHKTIFLGRWLCHSEGYPVYQMRFFHKNRMRFRDFGHGQREDTPGQIGWLAQPYIHHNFSKGVQDWMDKHNRYSSLEARAVLHGSESGPVSVTPGFFGNTVARRRFLRLYTRRGLPALWFLRFIWMYFLRLGFLDGYAGLRYCQFIAFYEILISTKLRELQLARTAEAKKPLPARPVSACGVSILVLTKDEQVNIGRCLESLTFSDDIVVLDSYSTDRTLEIVRQFPNVRILARKFDTWSRHSNWALETVPFKHPWVYYSDADEVVTPELRDEILRMAADPTNVDVAYRLRYKNMFMGRWLRHGGIYPVWILRFFKPDCVRYEDREVNAHPVVQGSVGELQEHFIHYSFHKGLTPWFYKHNSYSQMEAHESIRVRSGSFWDQIRNLPSTDRATRRRAIKNLSFYLPLREVVRFFYMYIAKGGFFDGRAGFHYACMISMYEYWIAVKASEKEEDWQSQTDKALERFLSEE